MSRKTRRGHNYDYISRRFDDDDLAELKPRKLFLDKWVILKKVEKRGVAHCYQVCDKSFKIFGILYLEIDEDYITSIATQIDFSLQQFSLGYSHRFTNIIDCNIINNHLFYMVTRIRPGPSIDQLLSCAGERISPTTVSFMAIDILSIFELLNASGHVLRNIDAKQWKFDVKTRMVYLDDTTDITVSSDKRHRSIDEIHILSAKELELNWTSNDLTYAPCSFIVNGSMHRMNELDMFESFIYLIWDWTRGYLPWKLSKCQQKTLEMKREFLKNMPNVMDLFEEEHHHWFNTAVHNLGDHLKVAKRAQEVLEKQAVRGGAWCPNGPRAGALLSIINYRRIIEDFHKIVCKGRPEWSVHWRDAKLDWDKEVQLTETQKSYIIAYEKRQESSKLVDEWTRLRAARQHYSIMKEHSEREKEKNQIAIDRYVKEKPNDPEVVMEMEKRVEELKEKRKRLREERRRQREDTVEKEIKEEVEEEEEEQEEDDPLSTSELTVSSSSPSTPFLGQQHVIVEEKEVKLEEPDFEEE